MEDISQKQAQCTENRRRFPRIRSTIAEYAPEEHDKRILSFTENISEGGICLFAASDLAVGAMLNLRIFIPYDHDPLLAKGKIVWRKQSSFLDRPDEVNYDIGIEFTEINGADRRNIALYIRKYSQDYSQNRRRRKPRLAFGS